MTNWHLSSIENALQELDSDPQRGLSSDQAAVRLQRYGPNALSEPRRAGFLKSPAQQSLFAVLALLLLSALFAWSLGGGTNVVAILLVLLIYLFQAFLHAGGRGKPVRALAELIPTTARVLRDGESRDIPARALVPGDILQLETGNTLAADVRLLEAVNLRIQESALAGGSEPVAKQIAALSGEDLSLAERRNMAYMGSRVAQGRGQALVVATGMQTELGRIATLLQEDREHAIPLQRPPASFLKLLVIAALALMLFIALLGFLPGREMGQALLSASVVAIALIPAALPILISLTLTHSREHMLEQQALVRDTGVIGSLGYVTVICTDKSGTLTENRMMVVAMDVAEHVLDLSGEMERGDAFKAGRETALPAQSALSLTAIGGALCNDAELIDTGDGHFHTTGDSTEGALVTAAARMGYWKTSLDASFPRVAELPFDPERKRMTTVHDLRQYDPTTLAGLEVGDHRYIAFSKGHIHGLLGLSRQVWVNGQAVPLDDDFRDRIQAAGERLVQRGRSILGVGFRLIDQIPEILQTDLEQNLTFVGLFGMVDPARPEVAEAMALSRSIGVRTIMMTGDQPLAASEIGRKLGVMDAQATGPALKKVMAGVELDRLSPGELGQAMDEVRVFARLGPGHKLKIVEALQAKGQVVAMTGDGVTDAPALRRADVGVAMGASGTEVAQEAAALVLLENSFASLVNAIRESRLAALRIQRFLRLSTVGIIARGAAMLLAPWLGGQLPLLPLQILWLSLLVDGLLGWAVATGQAGNEALRPRPADARKDTFTRSERVQVTWRGALIGALGVAIAAWYYSNGRPEWQSMLFSFLGFAQILLLPAWRVPSDPSSGLRLWKQPWPLVLSVLALALQLGALYLPPLANSLGLMPLGLPDLLIAAAAAWLPFIVGWILSTRGDRVVRA